LIEPAMTSCDIRILRLGADGDGIGTLPDGGKIFVPGALPEETVRVRLLGRRGDGQAAALEAVLEPSPARVEPSCPLFGPCGGCTVQHWQDDAYAAWKSGEVRQALIRAGYTVPDLAPLARTPPGRRRRMDLALRREGSAVRVGLHQRRSREIVDLTTCLVLDPSLLALADALRAALPGLGALRREGSAVVNLLESGPDLLLRTDADLTAADRTLLAAFAHRHGLPRIAWARGDGPAETACLLRPPVVTFSGATVEPPSGAFLQASPEGEAAIIEAVLAGLPERLTARATVIELYAGCGTLSFALAEKARVRAFEGEPEAVAALRRAGGGKRIEAVRRDLTRQPLTAKELADAAAIVLDPPYAGAAAQMPGIAASGVPVVIYVSCNPSALARDARTLREAGYDLAQATPIDQFLWSGRVESVAVFRRPKARTVRR
jgi:23S rRNA (uracil1939-C5)-methyltransferase